MPGDRVTTFYILAPQHPQALPLPFHRVAALQIKWLYCVPQETRPGKPRSPVLTAEPASRLPCPFHLSAHLPMQCHVNADRKNPHYFSTYPEQERHPGCEPRKCGTPWQYDGLWHECLL